MLGQRRRRWPNIKPALGERLVFAGTCTFPTNWGPDTVLDYCGIGVADGEGTVSDVGSASRWVI